MSDIPAAAPIVRTLFGYELDELLHDGKNSLVYRAHRAGDGTRVVIKTPRDDAARRRRAQALHWEFRVLRALTDVPTVVRAYGLEREGSRWGLVLHQLDGSTLRSRAGNLALTHFVSLALAVTRVLHNMHTWHVVHQDFQTENLIVAAADHVTAVDFASASMTSPSGTAYPPSGSRDVSAAYMSPEQSARLNRSVDYRTDYYSLGVTLFELLTGVLPFRADDPLKLVHAHVARKCPHPGDLRSGVPTAIAEILMKLMAKDAVARYQSMEGLQFDLKRCHQKLGGQTADFSFALGTADRSDPVLPLQRLYGRAALIDRLVESLRRSSAGKATMVVVYGPSGIGKSALIQEGMKRAFQPSAYSATAKCSQFLASAPQSTLAQLLDSLVTQLLSEGAERLADVRARVASAVPLGVHVLVELSAALELILGPQPHVGPLDPNNAKSRLLRTWTRFFSTFVARGRPLCVFVDDLQWASRDTIDVLTELLLSCHDRPLAVVVALRNLGDDAGAEPRIQAVKDVLAKNGIAVEELTVAPLAPEDVAAMAADALALSAEEARSLSTIVFARTQGNPLFVWEFLTSVHRNGLVAHRLDVSEVDLRGVRQLAVTENVADLLVRRVDQLPKSTRELVDIAACLGSPFSLDVLTRVSGRTAGPDLFPAFAADLIFPVGPAPTPAEPSARAMCRFAHDRVHQAILDALDVGARVLIHERIGRCLLSDRTEGGGAPSLFQVVAHLNYAAALVARVEDRSAFARLDLEASTAALSRGAGVEAFDLAAYGLGILQATAWHTDHDLTRDLHQRQAEAALLTSNYDALRILSDELLARAKTPFDRAQVRLLQGRGHHAQLRLAEAIDAFLDGLALLDVHLPRDPSPGEIAEESRKTIDALSAHGIRAIALLEECTSPIARMSMELLSKLLLSAASASSSLHAIAVYRLVRLSRAHGNIAESATGYAFCGPLLSSEGRLEEASQIGQAAIGVARRFANASILAQTYLEVNYLVIHWTVPLQELTVFFREGLQYAMDAGNPLEMANSACSLSQCRFLAGDALGDVLDEMRAHRALIVRLRQPLVLNWHEAYLQVAENLCVDLPEPTKVKGEWFDESVRVPAHESAGDLGSLFNYYLVKTMACVVFGDHRSAMVALDANERFLPVFGMLLPAVPLTYLGTIARLAACDEADATRRTWLLERVSIDVARLKQWLPLNPRSIEHKLRTIEAEIARVEGRSDEATKLFGEAVDLARTAGVNYEEGIACELAARFSLSIGDHAAGRAYLRGAHRAYYRWGALTKVKAIEREYRQHLPPVMTGAVATATVARPESELDLLDLVSVLHASRAIASELRLDRVLERLMVLLIESGGAQTGFLLVEREGHWVVEAAQSAERGVVTTLESVRMEDVRSRGLGGLATTVVNYVGRTGETVRLEDAATSDRFGNDAYVVEHDAKSILCFAIKRQTATVAIAYLENDLVRGAFTPGRVKILEMLSMQASSSIENARLYENLEQNVESRTRELREKNDELTGALGRLTDMQRQLVTQEKLAALGALTAGIAHEIKNPLNFVSNFADVSARLADEIVGCLGPQLGRLDPVVAGEVGTLLGDLRQTVRKIGEHGIRASAIVSGMALHASGSGTKRESADLNTVLAQSVALASHGTRLDGDSHITMATEYDARIGHVDMIVQDVSRVFVNLINNARHAMAQKGGRMGHAFRPRLMIRTVDHGDYAEVRIRDNGHGIPAGVMDKIFMPFFTTKPPGEGTGLGLSISHDIVVHGHGGELRAESVEGEFAELVVVLPKREGSRLTRSPA